MKSSLEKWQATAVLLAIIVSVTILALQSSVNRDVVIAGLFSIATLVLGAGAVAHGVTQGSKATADPPPTE